MTDHGLTPTRPRTTALEASVLEQIHELRSRVAALEARVGAAPCVQCHHVHTRGERCEAETVWRPICGCTS